ncbi:MAG: c-type cytochrome [Vicinamibacterales bacterium]
MSPSRSQFVLALLVAATVSTLSAQRSLPSSIPNRPFPPGLQPVSNTDSAPLSPSDELKAFFLPPGYRLELVASEPLVQDPIAMDWDADGRLWVIEMPGYMRDILMSRQFDPDGRIVVLEDTDGDGAMDKRTVFADHLVLARSLKVLDRGVLVAEPPNVWLMRDTNGDLEVDTRELVTNDYGRRDASIEHNANGFLWAMDNWMHTANSDVYLRLKNGSFEVQRTVTRGQWGVTQNDAGRIFRNTNESVLHVDLVPSPYFIRNPNQTRMRGSYESMADDTDALNVVSPARPNRGVNRGYQTGVLREDGRLAKFTSSSSPTVYRGDRLPADVYGNVFIAEPAGNTVSRIVLDDDGTALRAHKAYADAEFVTTTDERFRPVSLSNAPDGTLYIVDMYRGIIQQRSDITEYLRDQILARRLEHPEGRGRIFRVVHDTTVRGPQPSLSKASPSALVAALSHPNGWWRDTAQRLLVERSAKSAAPALATLVRSAADWRVRLQALWTLDGLDAADPDIVSAALADRSGDVRAAAIRVSEHWLTEPGHPLQARVLALMGDVHWAVRYQLAASIGLLPAGARETGVVSFLERYADDPVALDATLSGLRGAEAGVLDRLVATATAQTAQREAAITMLASLVARGAQDDALQRLFTRIAGSSHPSWLRAALLRGAEVALLNASPPGTPGRRGGGAGPAAAPCPTCPGARTGPGGAYAFPGGPTAAADQFVHPVTNVRGDVGVARPEAAAAASGQTAAAAGAGGGAAVAGAGGGRGGGRAGLRLNREPVALVQLASSGDELAVRAAALLARIVWPGKAGADTLFQPLTSEEQQRFNAGAEIYKNICQACHQADGRGQEKVAVPLVGSRLVLAAPEIPARIVLHGKEGTVGTMPPLGTALSDEQIAAVLTYIRREWGQGASTVDAVTIKNVRTVTAGRTRAWTEDELVSIAR